MDYSEFRRRSLTRTRQKYFICSGSHSELPSKFQLEYQSDVDIMFYCCEICAIPCNRKPPKNFKGTLLKIDSEKTPPGFAKLQICTAKTHDTPTYYRRPPFLSGSKTFGPARTTTERGWPESYFPSYIFKDGIPIDNVYAVYCPYWPIEAKEWITRKRGKGWPRERLIARITKGGCHFVSKLREESFYDDTEWRFSFSKAEFILIHSWTDFQKEVYHFLKMTKKYISTKISENDLSKYFQTYYFKTLMLWACENKPVEFWNESNIKTCVRELLIQFIGCLDQRSCKHYFIPDNNVMNLPENEHKNVSTIISFVKDNGEEMMIELDNFMMSAKDMDINKDSPRASNNAIDNYCLDSIGIVLPLNEKLNGRLGQHLADCESFMPEFKFLHAAIEANLRLMSFDKISLRRERYDYRFCLNSFNRALIKDRCDIESSICYDSNVSLFEELNRMLPRRQRKDKKNSADEVSPSPFRSPLRCITKALRANFYLVALGSYDLALKECKEWINTFVEKSMPSLQISAKGDLIPVLLSTSLSPMFDEHVQVILGFATLYKLVSSSLSSNEASCREVSVDLHCKEFLKYLICQCKNLLEDRPDIVLPDIVLPDIVYRFPKPLDVYTMKSMQLVDSSLFPSILFYAALRQSGAEIKVDLVEPQAWFVL